ncbi:MAG: hypothetical protein ACR2PK_11005 [Acidimicrobiales bacterium]
MVLPDRVRVVRVLPDVPAISKEFDYAVPEPWRTDGRASSIRLGTMVRIELHGRRVAGWVTEIDPADGPDLRLLPLSKLSGIGPPGDVIDVCRWAARRWLGPVSSLLRTASPPKMVSRISRARPSTAVAAPDSDLVETAFSGAGSVVRVPPSGDRWPLVVGAVARGDALIVVPSVAQARIISSRLRRLGIGCALYPRDWPAAAGGGSVVGTRSVALAPVPHLSAVLMIDEHDEGYQQEQAPTWHAREIVIERARRAGVPCVLTSPMPTLEALSVLPLQTLNREQERSGWPLVRVVDPREDGSARGTLWTSPVVSSLRADGRVACILNRKGRSRLLSCAHCDGLAVCEECDGALRLDQDTFECAQGHQRPVVCSHCGGTKFKNLRVGVTRAREELEVLLREPVVEVTADTNDEALNRSRVMVGTEALLHRVDELSAVAFVDFDQELSAPRYRAGEQALAQLVRAGRLVGGRREGRGEVLVQTRQPNHPIVTAAVNADVEPWTEVDRTRRELLGYPPFRTLAEVSGPGAEELMTNMGTPLGVEILGPRDGRWLIKAEAPEMLSQAFDGVERPKSRTRVSVDPLRLF